MPEWRTTIRERIAELRLDASREAAVAEELAQHAGDRYEELLARGVAPPEAERAVLEELDRGRLIAALRPVLPSAAARPPDGGDTPGGGVAGIGKDLRHGLRLLRLDPAFAVVAVLSLALGIGANTAIFQLLDAVRLRALPVQKPGELAAVRVADPPDGRTGWFSGRHAEITSAIWEHLREGPKGFSSIAAWSSQRINLSPGGEARLAELLWASGNLFETLGVQPLLGRVLSPADDRRGCAPGAVVVSEPFWRREFGADPSIVGRKITLDAHPFEVVGVTPARFFGLDVGRRFDVALPLCVEAAMGEQTRTNEPSAWWLAVVGRLKPGWTVARASAEVRALSPGIFRETVPPAYDAVDKKRYLEFRLEATPASTGLSSLRRRYADPLWLLLGISGLVLLIACANLANLMVARASARHREIAVRLALGASRRRLVQQLLAESFVLAAFGAACGAALAQAMSRLLVSSLATQDTRPFVALHFDWRLFAFTAGPRRTDLPPLRAASRHSGRPHRAHRGDQGGRPRHRGFPRGSRNPPRPRRLAGLAVARSRRRRPALRRNVSQPAIGRRRVPAGPHPRDRLRRRAPPHSRRGAQRVHADPAVARARDSRGRFGGRDPDPPGERQRLEREHPHRRHRRHAQGRQLQPRQPGVLCDHGHAAAGGAGFHRGRSRRKRPRRHRDRDVCQEVLRGREPPRPELPDRQCRVRRPTTPTRSSEWSRTPSTPTCGRSSHPSCSSRRPRTPHRRPGTPS